MAASYDKSLRRTVWNRVPGRGRINLRGNIIPGNAQYELQPLNMPGRAVNHTMEVHE